MGTHLTAEREFKSDKYAWAPAGFVPLKPSDKDAQLPLYLYALAHAKRDAEFSADVITALVHAGWESRADLSMIGVLKLAAEVRKLQRQFFETRERSWLPAIRAKEVELDNALRILIGEV